VATITASMTAYPGFPERIELHGREGSATLEQGKIVYWKQKSDKTPPVVVFAPPSPADLDGKLVPFQRQYREILESWRAGRPPLVTPREALEVVRTILNAYRARF
jgi:UDP-N-acetyl-2-amino-2-deoxyglucuronate dehydrogenase